MIFPSEILDLMVKRKSKQTSLRNKWLFIAATFAVLFIIFYAALPKHIIAPTQTSNSTATSADISTWKEYANSTAGFSLMYPSNWDVKELHFTSNRAVDDPKEINTAIIKNGNENEIMIQWGPMGFGGGCDEKDAKILQLKNEAVKICNGIAQGQPYDFEGNKILGEHEYWSQIYPTTKNKEIEIGVSAISTNSESETIKKIFSTLEVTN